VQKIESWLAVDDVIANIKGLLFGPPICNAIFSTSVEDFWSQSSKKLMPMAV